MADDEGKNYALGRLILDYIKVFLWPVVAVAAVLFFQGDVRNIISQGRSLEFFGVRIGERVEQIESQTIAEIKDIRLLLEQLQEASASDAAPELRKDIETKLDSLESNLSREVARVQVEQQALQAAPPAQRQVTAEAEGNRATRAAAAERRGFQALIDHDVRAAIDAFDQARNIWPDYHNVSEIAHLLDRQRDQLDNPESPAWPQLYREILTRYSWGLPEDLRSEIRAGAERAY